MKTNHLKALTILGLLLLAFGCKKDEPFQNYTLEIFPTVLSYGYDEVNVQKRVTVETTAPFFDVSVNYTGEQQGWLKVTKGDGFIDVAVASSNPGDNERRASVEVIVEGGLYRTVQVTQRAEGDQTDYSITLDPSSLEFAASGSELTKTSTVTTKGNGLQASIKGGENWYLAGIENNVLSVTVQPNETAQPRTGEVTVSNAQGKEAVLRITQAGKQGEYGITLEPATLTFASSGEELTKTAQVITEGTGTTAKVDDSAAQWITASLDGSTLTVTVGANSGDERNGTVTVSNAEGGTAALAVIQKSASDTSITLEPASLTFEATGNSLTKTSDIITNGTGLSVQVDETYSPWLSAAIEGKIITVTVTAQTEPAAREGVVRVTNAEGEEAALSVRQAGLEADITGTWSWSSLSSTDGNWANAEEKGGTATITAEGDEYTVTGITGNAVERLGVTNPEFHLLSRNGAIGVTNGEAFEKSPTTYYSTSSIAFPAGTIEVWNSEEAFAEVALEKVEIDGVQYLRLSFPSTIVATGELFPHDEEIWGQSGTVNYVYYKTVELGWEEKPYPLEFHKDIILLRPLQ